MMKIIGLTGGIGSGKSTASAYLRKKGCIIIDADEMSRKMTEKGSKALDEIRSAFGDEYFFEDGGLDRKKMAATVFSVPEKKQLLEGIITQAVIKKTLEEIAALRKSEESGIAVLDAPLLFEFDMQKYTDETWLVSADRDVITARVKARDNMSDEEVSRRISNQMPADRKEQLADRIIDNSADIAHLYAQLDKLLAEHMTDDNQTARKVKCQN